MKEVFKTLNAINVNEHTEKKKSGSTELTYLSWAWAWGEVKKVYPDATYSIYKDEQNRPYVFDPNLGYMVFASVTIEEQTYEMWLPVMDSHNAAMKNEPYEVKTKFSSYTVPAATMFDINKSLMRVLTKALAMHGLGLYIYAGEDLPEGDEPPKEEPKKADTKSKTAPKMLSNELADKLNAELIRTGVSAKSMLDAYKVKQVYDLTEEQYKDAMQKLSSRPTKEK